MTVATGQIDSRRIVRRLGAGRTPIVLQIVLFSLCYLRLVVDKFVGLGFVIEPF